MRNSDMKPGKRPAATVQNDRNRALVRRGLFAAVPAFFIFLVVGALISAWARFEYTAAPVTGAEKALARSVWTLSGDEAALPWRAAPGLQALSVEAPHFSSTLQAESAILIDASNGTVLFEKKADTLIPPASMTKLVAMYTAFRALKAGELSIDETIEPPEASWAENIPPHSSLMFLGKGQRLTIDELLRGMAVVSGNDGAVALALRVSGTVPAFVERMNGEIAALGLEETRFVEPSGLSGKNRTTAREFADFAMAYVREYPEALADYHSIPAFTYPQAKNIPAPGTGSANPNPMLAGLVPITQKATNPLLGTLEGCDGIKTGYIDESGYNLTLTAKRKGTRFIAVTLGGPGNNVAEGNRYREQDGRALMEWAFANWKTHIIDEDIELSVVVWGGKKDRIFAVPARTAPLTVPANSKGPFTLRANLQQAVMAPVQAGDGLGSIEWLDSAGRIAAVIPVIADRNSPAAAFPIRIKDTVVRAAAALLGL